VFGAVGGRRLVRVLTVLAIKREASAMHVIPGRSSLALIDCIDLDTRVAGIYGIYAIDAGVVTSTEGRIGNKMVTGLATSDGCHYNELASRRHRNCLANKDSKHHCNVIPIPRIWQTNRTQNSVG
jgi:hypothetical protein